MKDFFGKFLLAATLCFIAGCATQSKNTAQSGATATCHVCRYNNDLACVQVRVTDATPRADYQGTLYFFCSEDCREAFLKNPVKYRPKGEK